MKNLFDLEASQEVLSRIDILTPDAQALWGKMNAAQMLNHCSKFQDVAAGDLISARSVLGRIVGGLAKPIFYNDKPLPKDMSTLPELVIIEPQTFETERATLKQKIQNFQSRGAQNQPLQLHPFFGKLTSEQWGKGLYKHLDHHLKQFGV
ncbi:DUF1569 domain-containing protein [Saccharibacillus sp. JS10]|uniref:DUF1569 domain-containing protein n=1 Tax=Saccharibacillus sp. JS10 TaxID=2950552 RepID=UPI00210CC317|nr:DUF1569 domain-containing protein [Saccharibacillus sp. JS10]MCQ4085350.1 DUF1569 domain-containing protein [Saccharibacillus sp. JS10]